LTAVFPSEFDLRSPCGRRWSDLDVFEKIKKMICEQLDLDEDKVGIQTAFADIDADSLDIVELVMALEEEFNLEIADEEVEKIVTVGDVVKYIEAQLS
jgi:acyl carrier protein